MTRDEYLQELRLRLSHRLTLPELENTMGYYEEYFNEAGPEGEAGVIQELGSPERLVRQIMGEQIIEEIERPEPVYARRRTGIGAVWTVILALCAAPVAIPLTIALVVAVLAVVAGVGAAGVICVGFGIMAAGLGFTSILTHGLATTMYFVGGGMVTMGIGILMVAGILFVAGACFRGIIRLLGRALHRGEARA